MKLNIKQFGIYLANLNPSFETEAGKIRPVIVIQSDLLNSYNHSTIVCPLTTKVKKKGVELLRINLTKEEVDLKKDSDILVDQIRAIDNKRFIKYIGQISKAHQLELFGKLKNIIFS